MQVQDDPFVGIFRFEDGELDLFALVEHSVLDSGPENLVIGKVFGSYMSRQVPSCVSR